MRIELSSINLLDAAETIGERLPRLVAGLRELGSDVVALQEVLPSAEGADALHEPTVEALADAGLLVAVHGSFADGRTNAIAYRERVLTLIEAGDLGLGEQPQLRWQVPGVAYAVFEPVGEPGRRFAVISAHLAWGAEQGGARLANAVRIEQHAADLASRYPGLLVFAAGDFNEVADGAALQYLTGKLIVDGMPSFWVDLWDLLRRGDEGYTSIPSSHYAMLTARSVGIENAGLTPSRRLDYILVRGWAYQSLGATPDIETWGDAAAGDVSDHLGLNLGFDF